MVHPVRTNSEGHFLSASVSAHHVRRAHSTEDTPTHTNKVRNKRQTQADSASLHQTPPADSSPPNQSGPNGIGRGYMAKEAELFYNVTLFGQELHLRLHPNSRLIAPTATVEWWEESGHKHSQLIGHTDCFYTGAVSNMKDTSVAISNCDGLVGHLIVVIHCFGAEVITSSSLFPPHLRSIFVTHLNRLCSPPSSSSLPPHLCSSFTPPSLLFITPSSSHLLFPPPLPNVFITAEC